MKRKKAQRTSGSKTVRTSRRTHGALVQLAATLTTVRQSRATLDDAIAYAAEAGLRAAETEAGRRFGKVIDAPASHRKEPDRETD